MLENLETVLVKLVRMLHVITPILSSAVILALILLAFVTSNWWLPALLAAAFQISCFRKTL